MNSSSSAIVKSVGLHLVVGGLLVSGMHITPVPKPQVVELSAPIINAVSIDKAVVDAKLEKIKQEKEAEIRKEREKVQEQQRRAEAARKKQKAEAKRKAEERRKKEVAARKAKEKKLREQREKEEARKREVERKKKEEQQKRAEEKKRKREREEKRRKEQELKKQREAQERAEQERLLQEQLAAEQAAKRSEQHRKQVLSELQKYEALIRQTIGRHLIFDDSMKGKKCRLNIRLASNGLVLSVKRLQGDSFLCRAAESAVLKATTLPVSSDPDVFEKLKDINLTVEPNL